MSLKSDIENGKLKVYGGWVYLNVLAESAEDAAFNVVHGLNFVDHRVEAEDCREMTLDDVLTEDTVKWAKEQL